MNGGNSQSPLTKSTKPRWLGLYKYLTPPTLLQPKKLHKATQESLHKVSAIADDLPISDEIGLVAEEVWSIRILMCVLCVKSILLWRNTGKGPKQQTAYLVHAFLGCFMQFLQLEECWKCQLNIYIYLYKIYK